jgi:uncharacterized protein (TIGR03086 family)
MQDTIDDIERGLAVTGRLVEGIGADHWTAPTPCDGWDVTTVVNHVVGGMRLYAAELTGTDAGGAHEDDWLGEDPIGAYRDAATQVLAAWRSPGAEQRMVALSFGTVPAPVAAVVELTEIVVHGLDVAVATGQEDGVDQVQAERLLTLMTAMGIEGFRAPGIFGPEQPAPADAPAHRRLLAFLGRTDPAHAAVPAGS